MTLKRGLKAILPGVGRMIKVRTDELNEGVLSADAAGRALVASGFFDEATLTAALAAGAIATALLKRDPTLLTADATGRALMEAGLFDEATATDKFVAAAIANALLKRDAGLLSADATGRALMATDFFDIATVFDKFAVGSVDENNVNSMFAAGAIAGLKLKIGDIGDDRLISSLAKDPGVFANVILRMSGVYVDGDTFTIGTDVLEVDAIATDSTDDTAGGVWNNVTNPLTVAMPAATYPVLGVGGTGPLVVNELVYIGTEYLRVTAIVGNNVTFRRGAGGSAIAVHADAANIMVSATRPIAATIPVGVQVDFAVATVTPILAATINEPAGVAGQSGLVNALSLNAGDSLLITADAVGVVSLATTQVSANGLWDNATMRRGAAAAVKRVYRTAIVPDAEEATAEQLYAPLPFTPSIVLVRVLVTADGKELETAAANAVQKWDGATTIVAASAPNPAYVLLTAGTTVKWTGGHTLHILAFE